MSIKIDSLVKEEVRALIPYKVDGKDEYIEIKNPTKKLMDEIGSLIWLGVENPNDRIDTWELMTKLIHELSNIELNVPLESLADKECGHELNMVLYHITEILNEIELSTLMNSKLIVSKVKLDEMRKQVAKEINEVERIAKIEKAGE